MRVLIVGVAAGRELLEGAPGGLPACEVVGVVGQVSDAVRALGHHADAGRPVECVLVDLAAGLRTSATVGAVLAADPSVTLVVVTDDDRRAAEALAAGAHHHLSRRELTPAVLPAHVVTAVDGARSLRAHRRFERLLAASSAALYLVDEQGVVNYVSESARQLIDHGPEVGLDIQARLRIHPDDIPAVADAFDGTVRDATQTPTIEFRVSGGGDSWCWVETTISNHLADPAIGAVVLSVRDISGRKAAAEAAAEALAFQARLLDAVGQAVIGIAPDRRIIYWNEAATRTYGWTAHEAMGQRIGDLIAPAVGWEDRAVQVRDLLDAGQSWSGEFWVQHHDGRYFPILVSDTPVLGDDGELVATIATSTDISDRIRHEDRLRRLTDELIEDRRQLADAQRSAHLGSFELNLLTEEARWSDELFRILGLPVVARPDRGEYRGRIHPDDLADVDAAMALASAGAAEVENIHRVIRSDGELRWIQARNSVIRDGDVSTVLTGTILDITERMLAEATLAHQALHDPLTDLPNRAFLTQHLAERLGGRLRGAAPIAVVLVDLDQFKVINDSLGHAMGDRVLSEAADRLRSATGPEVEPSVGSSAPSSAAHEVTLGRFGGDEFVAMCEVDGAEDAVAFAEGLRSCFDEPFLIAERELYLSASVGIAVSCPTDEPETVLANADAAMYRAKELGRARIEVFDESLRERSEHRLELTSELRRAFAGVADQLDGGALGAGSRDELRIAYQPLIRLADGATVGFEALLRWDHPERGTIPPDEFIPIAEESGLIVPIGEWVLERALHQLAAWRDGFEGAVDLWIAVNLSARQLARPDLVERVAAAVSRAAIPPNLVHLEITESVLMDNIEASIDTVMRLRDLGMNLSVDDFGTGYSSLSYLKQLPIHTLKIDRSFVDGLDGGCADRGSEHTEDTSIVEAILSLGGALRLEVLAEGIETRTQLDVLSAMGCQFGQGYLWSPPVPPDEAVRWIAGADAGVDR